MRIAFVVNTFPPRTGGLEQHLQHLSQGLALLGHEVTVLTIGDVVGERFDGAVRVLTGASHLPVADVISFPSPGVIRTIARFLREHEIDVVSTHTRFFPMSYVGVRAAHATGIPVVHTEHGSGFVPSTSPVIAVGSRTVDHTMGRFVLTHADKVLGVSEQAASFACRLGAPHADVFHNAITPPERIYSGPQRPNHLVFVGRMVPGKGWETYLDAVARLRAAGHELTGEILGGGADLDAARLSARERGLGEYVSIPGRVTAQHVRQALGGATLVNPTVLSEGFQTTLLEAIAERGRVVTFDVPGAALLRTQGMPVRITADATTDALVAALDAHLRHPLPLGMPELIEPWTWPRRAIEYAQILEGVIR